ncbi:IclR family transcriptional regulator [Pediococcus argentinicus]|uniref:IclR family transcriptional regulator n=1 Tax=Pediococcus argentinicus TaxID=480391 RepID=UPI00338F36B1
MSDNSSTTLVKGLKIIELLSEHSGATLTLISQELSMNKTTVFRLLQTLITTGYVKKFNSQYSLTHNNNLFSQPSAPSLNWITIPIVKEIVNKYHATAFIGILESYEVVISQVFASEDNTDGLKKIGDSTPITMSALGKSIVAFLEPKQQEAFIEGMDFPDGTKYTLDNQNVIRQNLGEIKSQGFALDDEESEIGIRCLAVPIFVNGKSVASLGISNSYNNLKRSELKRIAKDLTQCSQQITNEYF